MIDKVEKALRWMSTVVGLGTLALALMATVCSFRGTRGRMEGWAGSVLQPPILIAASVFFLAAWAWLWIPISTPLIGSEGWVLAILGGLLLLGGCLLYLCGLRALGAMLAPSSGFGIALFAGHRLIETGP